MAVEFQVTYRELMRLGSTKTSVFTALIDRMSIGHSVVMPKHWMTQAEHYNKRIKSGEIERDNLVTSRYQADGVTIQIWKVPRDDKH